MSACLKNNRIFIGGSTSAPTNNVEAGDIYYNSTDDTLYRRDGFSTWVPIGSGSGITISATEIDVTEGRDKGLGWFDVTRGALYIWDEQSWIEILDPESASKTYISNTEPAADGQGDYWYNGNTEELYIWDGGKWILVAGSPVAFDELDELTDVTNSGSNGQVLEANGDGTFTFVDNLHTVAGLTDITNATSTTADFALQANGNGTFSFVDRVRELDDLGDIVFTTTPGQILVSRGPNLPQYGFIDHEHTLEDLTDIPSGSNNSGEVLSYSHSTGDFRFIAPSANASYSASAPSNPVVGQLWFDSGDSNTTTEDNVGLFVWDGYSWISCGTPITLPVSNTVTLDSSATSAATVNGFTAFQEIRTSDYISDGDTFEIPSDVWVWSDSTSTAALIVDTPNATIVNNGKIIGRGGNGGTEAAAVDGYSYSSTNGQAGGPAISVTASGVTIENNTGAYIAGGGGGGAMATRQTIFSPARGAGGGGGAGGGWGGAGTRDDSDSLHPADATYSVGNGGILNAQGQNGRQGPSAGVGGGGDAGGRGGWASDPRNYWGGNGGGGGGGRILPGSGFRSTGGTAGGLGGNAGGNGSGSYAGGGGGWGAAGGNSGSYTGGSGGAAVSGSYTQGTWAGTVYGSS